MAAPRKKSRSGKNASPSALDSERSDLLERQRQLDEKIAALNRTIKQATIPAHRMDAAVARPGAAALDKRFVEQRRAPRKVVLRAERQEGRMQTFALLLTVLALLVWAAYKYL